MWDLYKPSGKFCLFFVLKYSLQQFSFILTIFLTVSVICKLKLDLCCFTTNIEKSFLYIRKILKIFVLFYKYYYFATVIEKYQYC